MEPRPVSSSQATFHGMDRDRRGGGVLTVVCAISVTRAVSVSP